jgi:hypothetical protein
LLTDVLSGSLWAVVVTAVNGNLKDRQVEVGEFNMPFQTGRDVDCELPVCERLVPS